MKISDNITKFFFKLTIFERILSILFVLLLICIIKRWIDKKRYEGQEGYEERTDKFILKQDLDIYDQFYVSIYDLINYNKLKNQFEIGSIIDSTTPTEQSIILDVGSRTGHTVNKLNNISKNVIGVEPSLEMLKKAGLNYPNLKDNFIRDDILNNQLFENNSFTHILCLNYNFYYFKNKKQFFQNCYNWLMSGGYLILHLVDENKINPLNSILTIKSNVLPEFVDPNLILSDSIKFKDFNYKPNIYNVDDSTCIYEETFKYNNGNVRKHEYKLYMSSINDILKIAKYLGFIILKVYDMKDYKYYNNYLYILQKPN